ncbi:DUF305 domain-containing protein [Streptomyces sp. SID8361]|uniref:DUF305 domain-containing protein n=1 Tax=Streptomyces sp. MnatMP-M27 TaxID=1839768 RepID=UPI00081DB206|nr:DUF305 domain-containing protein [Streptomyces sp. MnatMP-M27]MYU10715.1 DUF305 domain-containing protein [Streptomyces sp. SID8361]SCF74551.1 Uncharacterized conserved protein, DUF305 family [Streptomyces sp. MnatMP-M27]
MTAAAVTRRVASAAVLLAATTLLTTGCGGDGGSGKPTGEGRSTSAARNAATRPPDGQATSGTFNSSDIGWIQLMIAMDDQAALLLGLVPDHSSDAGVEKWAKPVAADYRGELVQLRELLSRAGVPDTNPHQGHDMPGMVTEDELRTIEGTKDAAFDALFLAAMREHLDQAAKIAHSERSAGTDPSTKKLAASVEKTSLTWRARLPEATSGRP